MTRMRVLGESIEAEEEVSGKLHNAQISVPGIELTEATIQYRKSLLNVACTYEGRAGYSPEEFLHSLGPPSGGPAGMLAPDDEYGTATGAVPGGEIRLERCHSPNRRGDGYIGRLDVSRLRFVSQRRGTSGPYIDSYVLSGFGIDFWPRPVRRRFFPLRSISWAASYRAQSGSRTPYSEVPTRGILGSPPTSVVRVIRLGSQRNRRRVAPSLDLPLWLPRLHSRRGVVVHRRRASGCLIPVPREVDSHPHRCHRSHSLPISPLRLRICSRVYS